jgi:hypothetical protein
MRGPTILGPYILQCSGIIAVFQVNRPSHLLHHIRWRHGERSHHPCHRPAAPSASVVDSGRGYYHGEHGVKAFPEFRVIARPQPRMNDSCCHCIQQTRLICVRPNQPRNPEMFVSGQREARCYKRIRSQAVSSSPQGIGLSGSCGINRLPDESNMGRPS